MMIDKTIKNKKAVLYKVLEGILTAKISEKKKTLQGFGGNTYRRNSKYKKYFFFVFPMFKKTRYKNG